MFQEIGERAGPIDLGMIPIGAYQPRAIMKTVHMTPAEAVKALTESKCRRAIAMHWGTFCLTDEPLGEPPLALAHTLENQRVPPERQLVGAVGKQWNVAATAETPHSNQYHRHQISPDIGRNSR